MEEQDEDDCRAQAEARAHEYFDPPGRKIVQITAHGDVLYALCDDSSVWRWFAQGTERWYRIDTSSINRKV